jgi:hypothetical protein
MVDWSKELPISSGVFGRATVRPAKLRPVVRPTDFSNPESEDQGEPRS